MAGISGAFNFGALWESLPELTRETFANKSGAADDEDARRAGAAARPRRRARAAGGAGAVRHRPARSADPVGVHAASQADAAPRGEFVVLEEGNHVCANIPYITRPLVADWLRAHLG